MSTSTGPLTGIRVLDIGTLIAGPFGATLLGDFGAEVVKVEQPGRGDALRGSPRDGQAGRPDTWRIEARNKQSITLNLRLPEGQALLRDLVAHTDVLFENFTPGTLERWGLGWDALHSINPGLVMVRVSGYGQEGPYRARPGYDRIALGFSGYMYPTGFPDRYPVRPAFATADYNTATFGAFAAMMALYHRDARGGEGQMIDLALYEAPFRITSDLLSSFLRRGEIRERIGNRNPGFTPAGTFETADDRLVQIAAGGDNAWRRLIAVMGRADLEADPRFKTTQGRAAHADELEAEVAEWVRARPFSEVERSLTDAGVPVGGIYTAREIADDAHFAARRSYVTLDDGEDGPLAMPGVVPKLTATPGKVRSVGPALGADNEAVYGRWLGLEPARLHALAEQGVI